MAIKLKKFSRDPLAKLIAFMLTIIFITIIALQLVYIEYANLNLESIVEKEYKNSVAFENEVNMAINDVYNLLNSDGNEKIENENYLYFIKGDKNLFTNTNYYNIEFYQKNKEAFFAYINGERMVGEATSTSLDLSFPEGKDYILYLAFPDKFMLKRQEEWDSGRESLIPLIYLMMVFFIGTIVLICYLILVTGRKVGKEDLYTRGIDKIYTEFLILGLTPGFFLFSTLHKILHYTQKSKGNLSYRHISNMYTIGLAALVISCLFLVSLLSLARKIKDKSFAKGSIFFIIIKKIKPYLKELSYKSRVKDDSLTKSLYKRQIIFTIANVILFAIILIFVPRSPMMIMLIIPVILLIYWYIRCNNNIFKEIDRGFNESFEEQMKAERMKVELITNVSHDLKTPLTSIISYVDLLSKEEDLSKTAREYVSILSEKSDRLNKMVVDVFDLAKSTSGNIQLDFQTLDLKKLIEQTVGDMVDDIQKSGFQIKTNFPEEPVYIVADGKRLYRVFQNIIDNALKYSMEGTRIYISLMDEYGNATVVIQNIAGYEMNFTSEEILQRFSRGDGSRTTEGSGLGLSIAESFTKACGGDFKIEIDGDMFKVLISFRAVQSMARN